MIALPGSPPAVVRLLTLVNVPLEAEGKVTRTSPASGLRPAAVTVCTGPPGTVAVAVCGGAIHSIAWSKVGPGDWVGEVTVVFGPSKLKKVVPGLEFRRAAGLRSMRILSVTANAASLTIRGSGWGHGVGMCQVGCQEMGRAGYDETHILRYYYPGAEFTRLY